MNWFRKLFGKEGKHRQLEKAQMPSATPVTSVIPKKDDIEMEITLLLEAIREGNMKKANELIESTPNTVNKSDDKGKTPLRVAVGLYHKELVITLLQKGAHIDARDDMGFTPLHIASMHSDSSYAQILILNGANVNARTNDGRTPLHLVFLPEVATLLIQNGADVNAKDQSESSPLHSASANGNPNIVGILLANGANINSTDRNRQTPLHWAAWKSYPDIVRELITKGADVNAKDIEGFSALNWARKIGDDIDQILLKYGPGYKAKEEVVNLLLEYAGRQDVSQAGEFDLRCIECGGEMDQDNLFAIPWIARSPEQITSLICHQCFCQKFDDIDSKNHKAALQFIMWDGNLDEIRINTKYLSSLKCPHCHKVAPPRHWPPRGDSIPFYCCTVEQTRNNKAPGGSQQVAICTDCRKLWYVVWDDDAWRVYI